MNNNHRNADGAANFEELTGPLKEAVAQVRNEPLQVSHLQRVLAGARALERSGGAPPRPERFEWNDAQAPAEVRADPTPSRARPSGVSEARGARMRISRLAWSGVGATACAAGLILAFLLGGRASAFQDVAAKMREAKSYSCKITAETELDLPAGQDGEAKRVEVSRLYWASSGSVRQESLEADKIGNVTVYSEGKPGVYIDHSQRTFVVLPEQSIQPGPDSPGHWIESLARSPGKNALDLGVQGIMGRRAHGYQLESGETATGFLTGMSVRVWADQITQLPVLLEMETGDLKTKFRFEEFRWNIPLAPELFSTAVPAGYVDTTPPPVTNEQKEQAIAKAFAAYAELEGGNYPKTKRIFPDLVRDELRRKFAIPRDLQNASDEQRSVDGKIFAITSGFAWMLQLHRSNREAAYYGNSVKPDDSGKVLLRWRQDAGYRVLFGDLHYESVSESQLKQLEDR